MAGSEKSPDKKSSNDLIGHKNSAAKARWNF